MSERLFKGIWIPRNLYLDQTLTWTQKILILEIDSFSRNGLQCFISNEYLIKFLQVSEGTVEKSIKNAIDSGHIIRERTLIQGKSRRVLRLAHVMDYGINPSKTTGTTRKKVRHTNTSTKPAIKSLKTNKPESLEECSLYFAELDMMDQAQPFMDWYDQTGWQLKGGNKIKDWKATARNWARRQNKQRQDNAASNKGFNQQNFNANSIKSFVIEG